MTLTPFVHTFPAMHSRPTYTARAVLVHGRELPVCQFDGRDCYVIGGMRGTPFHIHFIDDGSTRFIDQTTFRTKAITPWPKP